MIYLFYFIAAIFLILFICVCIEQFIIITQRENITLCNLPSSFNDLRILQISDLHHSNFGKDQRRITERVKKEKPDIIVITGDLISRDMRDFSSVGNFCRELSNIAPVFFSIGNHEIDLPQKVKDTYFETLRNSGVHLLLNSEYVLKRNNETLKFVGASLKQSVYHDGSFSYKKLDSYSMDKLKNDIGVRTDCTIMLCHNPLVFETISLWNADLVLSGHVHGGIIRIPFIGGLFSPERKFFPKYTKGLYNLNSSKLYVSAGLGKLRLFNPPEINLITLLSEK